MSYFQRLFYRIALWMRGRNGLDQLSIASLIASLLFQLAGTLLNAPLLVLAGYALFAWTLFRVFSKRSINREEENRKFLALWPTVKTKVRQFFARLKNMRQYKYFKCPQCKALLRLTRGQGEKEVCCPQCRHRFRMKA